LSPGELLLDDSGVASGESSPTVPAEATAEDDPTNPIQVNREIRKRLVWRAERGAEGRKFKQQVNAAYDFKCAFTGLRFPILDKGYLPGVDAAHIYPWSKLGVNEVTNGLSLSKQMHWAFDEGVLRLTFDGSTGTYLLELGSEIATLAAKSNFNIEPFAAVCGPLKEVNLPADPKLRPNRLAIEMYNALMFPQL
jgi:hypothetical protein